MGWVDTLLKKGLQEAANVRGAAPAAGDGNEVGDTSGVRCAADSGLLPEGGEGLELIVASDGYWDVAGAGDFATAAEGAGSGAGVAKRLCKLAAKLGSTDDVSVAVLYA